MFRDAHTDARTGARRTHGRTGQNHYAFGHSTLGGGIQTLEREKTYELRTSPINTTITHSKLANLFTNDVIKSENAG